MATGTAVQRARAGSALTSVRAWSVLLGVLATSLALDLWSKSWSFEHVAGYPIVLPAREVVAEPSYRLPFHEGMRVLPWLSLIHI